jgi:hypothetical protein
MIGLIALVVSCLCFLLAMLHVPVGTLDLITAGLFFLALGILLGADRVRAHIP